MRILLMTKCSGELDFMRKSEADSRLCLLTNKLVSSVFKNTENNLPNILQGDSKPHLLHRKLDL
jgi:hypothetical protein